MNGYTIERRPCHKCWDGFLFPVIRDGRVVYPRCDCNNGVIETTRFLHVPDLLIRDVLHGKHK